MGQIFAHGHEPFGHAMGFKKSIRPTRTTFQGGLHLAGACRLPYNWNGCANKTNFCYHNMKPFSRLQVDKNLKLVDFHLNHYFDELVMEADARLIDSKAEGVLNHFQYRRQFIGASAGARAADGEYTTAYFSDVYEALERRGLVMPMELQEMCPKEFPKPDSTWLDHVVLNDKIAIAKAKSKTQAHVWLDPDDLNSALSQISLQDIMKGNTSTLTSTSTSTSRRLVGIEVEAEADKPENPEFFMDYLDRSRERNEDYAALPSFSTDKSEMFLASMIEREADSWNLHLTTFLMTPNMTKPDKQGLSTHNIRNDKETLKSWSKFIMTVDDVKYEDSGIRDPSVKYFCKIKATSADDFYTVQGAHIDVFLLYFFTLSFNFVIIFDYGSHGHSSQL